MKKKDGMANLKENSKGQSVYGKQYKEPIKDAKSWDEVIKILKQRLSNIPKSALSASNVRDVLEVYCDFTPAESKEWLSKHYPRNAKMFIYDKAVEDGIQKENGGYVNRGKEGSHGKFSTKEGARKQQKAMFANGYKGDSAIKDAKWTASQLNSNIGYYASNLPKEPYANNLRSLLNGLKSNEAYFSELSAAEKQQAIRKIEQALLKVKDSKMKDKAFLVKKNGKQHVVYAKDSLDAVRKLTARDSSSLKDGPVIEYKGYRIETSANGWVVSDKSRYKEYDGSLTLGEIKKDIDNYGMATATRFDDNSSVKDSDIKKFNFKINEFGSGVVKLAGITGANPGVIIDKVKREFNKAGRNWKNTDVLEISCDGKTLDSHTVSGPVGSVSMYTDLKRFFDSASIKDASGYGASGVKYQNGDWVVIENNERPGVYMTLRKSDWGGNKNYTGAGIVGVSLRIAKEDCDHQALIEKLEKKYGKEEGRRKYLAGETDKAVKDAQTEQLKSFAQTAARQGDLTDEILKKMKKQFPDASASEIRQAYESATGINMAESYIEGLKDGAERKYIIYQNTPWGNVKVVEWKTDVPENKVAEEFLEYNPQYRNKGLVTAKLADSLGEDLKKYQEWVDYDMKHYGKISEKTNEELKKAGLKVVKDKYGDYEVMV